MDSKILIFSFFISVVISVNIPDAKRWPGDPDPDTFLVLQIIFHDMNHAVTWVENGERVSDTDKKLLLQIIDKKVKPQIKENMLEAIDSIMLSSLEEMDIQDELLFSISNLHDYISNSTDIDSCTNEIRMTIDTMKKENISSSLRLKLESLEKKNNEDINFVFSEMMNIWPMIFQMIMSNNFRKEMLIINNNTEGENKISSESINSLPVTCELNWWLHIAVIFIIICVHAVYWIYRKCTSSKYQAVNKNNNNVQV